jgi:hypothetical protein
LDHPAEFAPKPTQFNSSAAFSPKLLSHDRLHPASFEANASCRSTKPPCRHSILCILGRLFPWTLRSIRPVRSDKTSLLCPGHLVPSSGGNRCLHVRREYGLPSGFRRKRRRSDFERWQGMDRISGLRRGGKGETNGCARSVPFFVDCA